MPPPIPVVLATHDPEWTRMAAGHAERLGVLGSILVAVHHIGSTAIRGLAAKPIIDLMPLVTSLADLDRERRSVERLGYDWNGELGMSGRRYCALSDDTGRRVVQLHCFEADSSQVRRHLAFRDYLRAHPEAARAYETEKRRAQALHSNNSHAYTDAKAAWIRDAEAEALAWFAEWKTAYPWELFRLTFEIGMERRPQSQPSPRATRPVARPRWPASAPARVRSPSLLEEPTHIDRITL